MTLIAPTLQAFFSDRLAKQLHASPRTIASYRDTLRLLLCFAQDTDRQSALGAGLGRPRRAADRRVPRPPRDRASQQRTDAQPAAHRDPLAVLLRRAAPPRARRRDRARAEHPTQAVRPTDRHLPHRRGIPRVDRRGATGPLGRPARPGDAHARAPRRPAGLRADRGQLRRRRARAPARTSASKAKAASTGRSRSPHDAQAVLAVWLNERAGTAGRTRCSRPAPADDSPATPSSAASPPTPRPPQALPITRRQTRPPARAPTQLRDVAAASRRRQHRHRVSGSDMPTPLHPALHPRRHDHQRTRACAAHPTHRKPGRYTPTDEVLAYLDSLG